MKKLTPLLMLCSAKKLLITLLERLLGVTVIIAVILNMANIIGRYLFGRAVIGAEEVLIYLMIGIVFAGTVLVTLRNQHMSMSMVVSLLPARLQRGLHRAQWLLIAILAGFIGWVALTVSLQLKDFAQTSLAAGVPMWIPHGVVALGFALSAVITLGFAVRGIRHDSEEDKDR